jgi:ketosteroid isomerase-like protein
MNTDRNEFAVFVSGILSLRPRNRLRSLPPVSPGRRADAGPPLDRGLSRRLAIGFVSIALLGASPVLAADSVRSEIETANKVFEAAVSRSDGPGVAALYTGNAQLLPAGSDFVTGTEAIGQFWQAAFDSGMKGVSLVTREVEKHGDTAYEVGELEIRDAEGTVLDRAKYVVIWKQEGTSWKLHRDIWTTSEVPIQE